SNAVFLPASSLRMVIVQLRYKTIERGSKSRFDRLFGLELIPQLPEFVSLILRKQAEQTVRCAAFAFCFVERASSIVKVRIPGINLDNIVNENHLDHAC